MPVEVESTSQIEESLRVLRRRVWMILIPFVLAAAVGTSFAILVPKKYVASTRVLVREVHGGPGKGNQGASGAKVASHVIRSAQRIEAAIEALKWPWKSLTREEQDLMRRSILADLTVRTPIMGMGITDQVVVISFAHTDPAKAFDFVTEISDRWRTEVLEGNINSLQEAFDKLKEMRGEMREELKAISSQIATQMKQYGIPPWTPDPYGRGQPLAPEFERLATYRAEREVLDEEFAEARAAFIAEEKAYARMDDQVPLLETRAGISYRQEIDAKRDKISTLRRTLEVKRYKPANTRYKKIQDEIRVLQQEIETLEQNQVAASRSEASRPNPDKAKVLRDLEQRGQALDRMQLRMEELDGKILEAEVKTAALQTVYQELEDLRNRRERLNENLVKVENDYQTKLVSLAQIKTPAGSPFVILDQGRVPTLPTEPSPILIIVFAVFLGLGTGVGMALLSEYGRSCFRNVNDITRVMFVPVLGTINTIVTGRQRRHRLVGRTLVGGLTLLIVAVLGFLTWAWEYDQDLLSDGMRNSIEAFRKGFE